MQFIDLKTQYQRIKPLIDQRIHTVLDHGSYIMGPEIGEMEKILADYVGAKHCISMGNGTDALLLAMMALGIQAGDEVITTPLTFFATVEMIKLIGAIPVLVDIDPKTYNIDPNKIEAAITPKTKAIMPVSLYGQCADFTQINAIATKHHLAVIEDGAQSFGATQHGKFSCALSTIGCTSFFPSKPLGCYGDGGACFTNDDNLAKIMSELRVHGQSARYHHTRVGVNARMDTLQAAVVIAKMTIFHEEVLLRKEIGARYSNLLSAKPSIITPYIEPFNTSVYAQYTIQVDDREGIQNKLKAHGIPTAVHYPIPVHLQPAFGPLSSANQPLPIAEHAAQHVLSLPMHPYLTEEDIQKIVAVL
jgi:UDP-2-acetamido-2-deoxy-ribo-hexuluronate aminotransferase